MLGAQLAVAEAMLPQCQADRNVECLHDLRVAIRRSRTVLSELRTVFPRDARRNLAAALRWMQTVTGPTRDLDVLLLRWAALARHLPEPSRPTSIWVHDLFEAHRAEAFETLRAELHGSPFVDYWEDWQHFVKRRVVESGRRAAAEPLAEVVAPRIEDAGRRLVRGGAAIAPTSAASALHDLRKDAKRVRYLLELFGDAVLPGDEVRLLVGNLKGVQEDLGRFQDDAVQTQLLRSSEPELLERAAGGDRAHDVADVVARLLEVLEADQRDARSGALRRLVEAAGLGRWR